LDNPDDDLDKIFREPEAMSAILLWLIQGFKLFKDDGHLETPESLDEELENFRKEAMGQLEKFLNENLKKDEKAMVKISDIRVRHAEWAKQRDIRPLTKHAFLPAVRMEYPDNVTRDGSMGNVLKGYSLVVKPTSDDSSKNTKPDATTKATNESPSVTS
jgi:hypothetical protein